MALILWLGWACVLGGLLQYPAAAQARSAPNRFTKAENGVITDRVTGLEWYVGPNSDNTWHQAKEWAENLNVDGGGWRLPTLQELKALYLKGASPINMDPVFQVKGAWVWSGELHNSWSAWGFAFYSGLDGWHHLDYPNGRVALAARSCR
jgi:hypothetical protein